MRPLLLVSALMGLLWGGVATAAPPLPAAMTGGLSTSVDAVAARIDRAALQMEAEFWKKAMDRTPPQQRQPLTLAPVVSDEVFIRRAYLDLQARLPDAATVRAFLTSTHPQKRAGLVDRLLDDPLSGARRFLRLASLLRVKDRVMGVPMHPYVEWLREATGRNMPYDQMVRALITSSGDLAKAPASGFLMTDSGYMPATMQEMMRVFLDEEIQCAACHDHPFSDFTQMQYYRLAACLTSAEVVKVSAGPGLVGMAAGRRVTPEEAGSQSTLPPGEWLRVQPAVPSIPIFLPKLYLYRDGKSGQAVKAGLPVWGPKGMGALVNVEPKAKVGGPVAVEFADWLVGSQYFANVAALRTWQELFGLPLPGAMIRQGGVDESDKSPVEVNLSHSCQGAGPWGSPYWTGSVFGTYLNKDAGPQGNPFAAALGAELVRLKYNLKEFERAITRTQAYQRQARMVDFGEWGGTCAPAFRRLPADTIWNNLMLIHADGATAGKVLLSHELPQVPEVEHPSRILGRGSRVWTENSSHAITHPLVKMMMTGETVKQACAANGPLVTRLKSIPHADLAAEEAFLAVLGRLPTQREKLLTLDYCLENPGTGWSDTVWSLINTSEFVFQY